MTADTVGGVWTYSLELAAALAPHGVDLILATMGAPLRPEQRAELSEHRNIELYESGYRLEWMDDPWPDLERAGEWLLEVADRVDPDLVHLNGYYHAALPWGVPVLVVAHSCVVTWWSAVKGGPAPPDWDRYRAGVAYGLAAADLVVTPSSALLVALQGCYGPLAGASVISNARDPSCFPVAQKEPMIVGAGRIWDEAKNLAALAEVAPSLSWPVYLAGETAQPSGEAGGDTGRGSVAGGRATVAGGESEAGAVHYLGRLSAADLAGWLGRAAVYALPARYEPFGLSALEAALAGCALVLGDIPSLREVWGDTAIFVPPNDTAALRRALEELIGDEALRAEFAGRARARALECSPKRMGVGYLAAYAEAEARCNAARGVERSCV
jgi:glycosyltransferase involved in cell wall biosynthesis